jgi:hypothetical protein
MSFRTIASLTIAFAAGLPFSSHADVSIYSQDFELLAPAAQQQGNNNALSNDGWLSYGNVFSAEGSYLFGYFLGGAPNGSSAFSGVVLGVGGPQQGGQQLVVYSDYNNSAAQGAGQLVESLVYQERTIGAGDVGTTWLFQFDAARYNLAAPSTAQAYIQTIDPTDSYRVTGFSKIDMTSVTANWGTYSIPFTITAGAGQLLQFGFSNVATNYAGSGVAYDNVSLSPVPEHATGALMLAGLGLLAMLGYRRRR